MQNGLAIHLLIHSKGSLYYLVPSKGLEPPHRCRYMDLNHARLPIPPRWQVDFRRGSQKATAPGRPAFLFYRRDATCQTINVVVSNRIEGLEQWLVKKRNFFGSRRLKQFGPLQQGASLDGRTLHTATLDFLEEHIGRGREMV